MTTCENPAVVVGLDIGGANLKLADTTGLAVERAFALWQHPQQLAGQLAQLLGNFAPTAPLAVTMTGELADCFEDAADGVRFIAQAVRQAAPQASAIAFYSLQGSFAGLDAALARPDDFAASNWHALASYLAAPLEQPALLIDIGSTTSDIIPLEPGRVATSSRSDFDRLQAGELVYVGLGRTPLCSVVDTLPIGARQVPVMNECFATSGDCAVILGLLAEDASCTQTADGRPRTRDAARARLARMVGLDHRHFTFEQAIACSRYALTAISERLAAAIAAAPAADQWILSGHGQALVGGLTAGGQSRQLVNLVDSLGAPLSRVAPAYAVAQLLHSVGS